jgi:gephyrin
MATETTFLVGVLVVSTTAAKDPSTDSAGKVLRDFFATVNESSGGKHSWQIFETRIVGDDKNAIQAAIEEWTDPQAAVKLNLIVTTGGTGFAVTDCTPEVGFEARCCSGQLLTLCRRSNLYYRKRRLDLCMFFSRG